MNDEKRAVLDVNRAFYEAFIHADYQAMESLWAQQHDVAVVHPGWSPLHGRNAVMDTWRRILTGAAQADLNCSEAVVYFQGEAAFVVCIERIPGAEVAATNIFVRENGGWKMTHHHGGLIAQVTEETNRDVVH